MLFTCTTSSYCCSSIYNADFYSYRLRELLVAEEDVFLKEMEAKQETMEERQQKMSVRAKELKEKREAERLKVVQAKLDQQWR